MKHNTEDKIENMKMQNHEYFFAINAKHNMYTCRTRVAKRNIPLHCQYKEYEQYTIHDCVQHGSVLGPRFRYQ